MKRFLLKSKSLAIMLIILNLLIANAAFAKTTTWNLATGGLWTTAGNWNNGLPVAGDDVIINATSTAITAVPTISLNSLTINGNTNLTAAANTITVTGTFSVAVGVTLSMGTDGNSTPRLSITLASTCVGSILGTVNVFTGGTNAVFTNNGDLSMGSAGVIADGGGGNNSDFSLSATGILRIASLQGISTTAGTGNIRVTGTRTYTAGSEIVYNGSAVQFTGNGIPTTSDITINNGTDVILSAAYTGTGILTMTSGDLDMANFNLSVGGLTGTTNITNGSGVAGARTLSVTGTSNPGAYSGVISNGTATSVSLTKTGSGILTLTGVNTYTGVTTINAGVVAVASIEDGGVAGNIGAATGVAANLVLGGGTLRFTGFTNSSNRNFTLTIGTTSTIEVVTASENITISGASTNTTGALTKTGAGTLTLSGANLHTGTTTITAGTLAYGANNALSNGSVNVNGGTLNIGTFSDAVGAVTLTSGTISGTTGVLTGTSYTVQSGDISAILGGAVNLTKSTNATVTLTGLNTYTGTTTISAGTLSINTIQNVSGGASSLGAPTTVANGTIALSTGTSVLRYTGTGHSSNRVIATSTDGSGIDASGPGALTLTGGVTSGGGSDDLELTGTGIGIMNSVIATVGGALDKTGSGTWTLSAANTYTGTTTVSAGILEYGINSAISSGDITVSGGTLDIKTFTDAVDLVTLTSGNILGTTGILTGTSYAVQSGNITAILAGAGVTLTKSTAGTVTMSGTNTFTGAKTISAGTLIAANTQALGTTAGTLNLNGGTLNLATDVSISAYNVVVGANSTIVSNRATAGAGIVHTLGTLSIGNFILSETAGANVNSGTAELAFGTTTLSASTPRFDVTSGANLTLGALVNNSSFTKQGTGQLTLNTASARTGGTVTLTDDGTLVLGNVSALGTTAVPLVLNAGTLNLATDASVNAYNTTVNGIVTIASNRATSGTGITHTLGTLSIGAGDELNVIAGNNVPAANAGLAFGATTLTAATPLFDLAFDVNLTLGAISGNVAFTKQGNGLMTLNTASGRTGGTVTINTGSIRLGNASALGTTTVPVVLNAGSGLNLASAGSVNAYNVTVNGNAIISSNRATSGPGITHTLGTLTIGNSTLTVLYGDNVSDVTAGLTFGATTLTAATPVFDAFAGAVTITLGAVSGNFAFNKDGSGRLVLNTASARTGGTVTLIDGTISLGAVNALGTTTVPLQLNGGILDLATATTVNAYNTTIGGNVIITPNKNIAGAGITHVLGTLSTGAFTLNVNQGTNVNSGTAAVQFGNLTMTGAPVFSPNSANLIMAGTATGAFKITKSGAATLQKTTIGWTLGGDFEITAGTYDATTQNTTLLGNWINNGGTHTASGASTVLFNGSSAQSIGGSSSTTFNNLTINNANGVSLANNETVNAAVTLTNGNLIVPTGNTLTFENGNAVAGSGFSASKSIVTQVNTGTGAKGFLRVNNMAASAAYSFPVSDGTNYLPVTLTPTDVTANNTFSVCVFQGITTNGEPNGTPFSTPQKNNCVDAVWTVNYNGPGTPTAASANMIVGWPATLEGINFSGYSDVLLGIAHWDGPNWGTVVGTGNNTSNNATRTGITQFSPFGVGRIDPTGGVLAIRITYFNASKGNGFNTLNWQAACSSSQAIFELERSVDGVNFMNINSITATQARCASPFSYNDITAPAGTVFYRIKIIDVDGKVTYSAIVKLGNPVKDFELSGIAPNPVMNIAQVKVNTTKKEMVSLLVTANDGKVVYRSSVQLQPGSSIINVDISNLPSGVYMLKGIFSNGQTNSVKFIKQ